MGVPKFYRWISERYPCLSEVVKEFQIPEFDNLYLDMNGIIHVCSHPDDGNPHFRITEEKIFRDIFHYLEFLFRMIKPRKVFFMAIDGVAPRAKMNQQRGRRFRSAREAEELERKARESGEVLPTEKRFDSNCITPGTEFMVKLQEQLKYFVTSKISNDPLWHGVDVYLSGHETPGEGEHKIMDFIRQKKSQPSYDPNTRHCLYGLDADLIMLGLTSHEPHFSLLREEVRFGGHKDKNKRPATPEETTFHLLHLSLMREYLDFEFESLKDTLPFGYDLEKVIDDWVLMGFLVGNDFIPHLPHLHIQHDALPLLWKTYMNILPECGGYLNDGGHLNLERFEQYMKELSKFDVDKFEETFSDLKWLETKIEGKAVNMEAANVADEIKARKMRKENENMFAALQDTEEDGLGDEFLPNSRKVSATTPMTPDTPDSDEDDINTFDEEFTLHKKHYYMTKMEYENVDKEVLRDQSEGYIRAIQWILLYYYEGVPSWSWFYPHHYAPYISDVTDFKNMKIEFELSTPFLPFQQLMAVLPAASKELLPEPYQKLMTQDYSPVIDFYPVNFQTDLNGKQQDWEAVVLIPFIDENRLLDAMRTVESKLSDAEKKRNRHGPCLLYNFTKEELDPYPSSLPGSFPDIVVNYARLTKIPLDAFIVDKKKLWKGLLPGVKQDVYFPGFPTLKHLPHRAFLKKDGVKVFQHCSKNDNMLLEILCEEEQVPSLSTVASEYVGKAIYVSWPHLFEAKVISVSDREERFVLVEETGHKSGKSKRETKYNIQREPLEEDSAAIWCSQVKSLSDRYKDRLGIIVGDTYYLLMVQPMIGRKYICGSHGVITHDKQFAKDTVPFLLQTTVKDITVHDPSFCQFKTLRELFPVKEMVFMLGWPHYGGQGEVMDTEEGESPRVRINVIIPEEPKLEKFLNHSERYCQQYFPGYVAAQRAGISSHFLSRITGSIFIKPGSADNPQEGHNINIGLNMKFTKRSEEMPGYTKQTTDGWTYSQKAITTVSEYMQRFPEIVESISNNDRNKGDVFYENDLFGDTGVTLKQVQDYLKSLPCAQIKMQKVGTDNLDEGVIKAIEQEVDRVIEVSKKCKRVKMQVKPHLLFRPIIGQGGQIPDQAAKYYLFDRVVNVRHGYSVPFGLRGTVVGIHEGEKESDVIYEVVFDEAFQGGLTIRCSEGRGYRVPPAALINITYGERKHGARADPIASQQNSYDRTQNYQSSQPQNARQGSYSQNAWQQGQSSRGYNETVANDNNRQGYYSSFRDRNDNRAFYNDNYYDDYDNDYYYGGYDASNRKRQQYDKNTNVRSPRGNQKNQHEKHPGAMGSPRGNQQNQRQVPKENAHKHPGANDNQSEKSKKTAAKPDSLNLRQQSFDGSESVAPPMFVTPKISPGRNPRRDSGGGGQSKIYHDTHNSEFANMWKELQTGANESGKAPSGGKDDNKGPTLMQAAEVLPKVPSPNMNDSETTESKGDVDGEKKVVTLDSLFKEASKVKSEEDQFAAMFQSLQISAEKKEEKETTANTSQNPGIVQESTNALKQMLKIGSEDGVVKETREEVTSESSKTYGRQVSLQELFEGVKGQLPATTTVAPAQTEKSPPQGPGGGVGHPSMSLTKQAPVSQPNRGAPPQNRFTKPHQKPQQLHQQLPQQGVPNRFPVHHKRNPVMELKNWCQTVGLREPKYDFFGQAGTFACVVTLSNGARFQGSVTRTQEEAAESAAGATLLHVGAFRGPPVHPLMSGGMPQFPPPPPSRQPSQRQAPPRQFSSPNSAFKPVSAVLNGPYQFPNQYPNQRHYSQPPQNQYNQPNQFSNPRYTNQFEDRRGQQQPCNQNNRYNNRSAGKRQSQEKVNEKQTEMSKQDEKGKEEVIDKPLQTNPFIPMQVTRKTPQKRRESESESRNAHPTETKSNKTQEKEVKNVVRNILPENKVTVNQSDKSDSVNNESSCDGPTLQTLDQKQTDQVKTPSKSESKVKEAPQTPSDKQPGKRRTRIAANFNFGGN